MRKIKRNKRIEKKYIILFLIFLFLALLQIFYWCGAFSAIISYFFEPGYRENYAEIAWGISRNVSLFEVFIDVITSYNWEFDYMIIFGTSLFQILLPCFVSIFGIYFYDKYSTIYQISLYREKKHNKYLLHLIVKESFYVALTIFSSYLAFYVILLFITKGNMFGDVGRELFLDILGTNFYYNHTLLYYFIFDGMVRFLVVPFIYAFLSCSFATICKSQKKVFFSTNCYYYGLCIVGATLHNVIGTLGIYINPSIIMVSGSYNNIHTIPLLCMQFVPLIIGFIIIYYKGKKVEI